MRSIKTNSILRSLLLGFLLLSTLCPSVFLSRQVAAQQQTNQQRPRRVNGSQPQSATSNSTEEVDEGDVVRVDTQLVSVPAIVTNKDGQPLSDLRRENFVVYEDGQPQTLANFGTTETPFEIALLLDTSGSTRDDVALIRQAANAFIDALRAGDRVAVEAFNTADDGDKKIASVEVLAQLTGDRKTLRQAIENLGASNGTPFYDALEKVVTE
ncbi:MAG TPA: VWA domain-containing protein, partial [Pyrinomonadaceae bacterium]|nr:VWA domain-containing protein [Pyrinomonadaceae bacterium]